MHRLKHDVDVLDHQQLEDLTPSNLPPPNETVNVFEGDFSKQHTPHWWRNLFENSTRAGKQSSAKELEDADVVYEEMVRYEHEHNIDPFDVEMCLEQAEWGRANRP